MRFATTALSLYTLYTSAHGEVATHCEFHPSSDVAALLQVGSLKKAENSSLLSINVSESGNGTLDRIAEMLRGISRIEAPSPKTTHSYGIFHYRVWSHPHWKKKKLPANWRVENVLNSAKGFDWICLVLSFTFAFILRWVWLWQDDGKLKCHLTSMAIWLLLAIALGTAIWRRFGKVEGMQWAAGYVFELFFMLENVFVFRYVIHAAMLPRKLVSRLLDRVVWAQIIFEAVFFLGLAHQLRSFQFLPLLLGIGLTLFGVSTLMESISKDHRISQEQNSNQRLGAAEDDELVRIGDMRLQVTGAGFVWLLLLVIDFSCEIDTVLTKIEEIQNPFIAFSSSMMAAFSLPELYLLSQDLLAYFPLVKCGIGLILCLLGLQMLLARIVVIQPLVTCAVMLGIILAFIGISALVDSRSTEIEAELEDEKTLS